MQTSQVKNLMKSNPVVIDPQKTLKEAAKKMKEIDCGVLPVGTQDELEGVITDRDIVLRAVAEGKDVNREKIKDYMTEGVCYCNEDDTVERAAKLMRENDVNRLMVRDRNDNLTGVLTFGRIIREDDSMEDIACVIETTVGEKVA